MIVNHMIFIMSIKPSAFDNDDETQPDRFDDFEEGDEQRDDSYVMNFDVNDELDESSEELSSEEVLTRIESFVAHWIEQIGSNQLPLLSVGQKSISEKTNGSQTSSVQTRSLVSNQGAQCLGIARIFLIIEVSHELLRTKKTTTQRDIYYKLVKPPLISSPNDVNSAIQDVCTLLGVTRASLGITCASRGSVSGLIMIREPSLMAPWQDLSLTASGTNTSGYSIPGSIHHVNSLSLDLTSDWHDKRCFLLVVEKDAVFQRLTQDRLFDSVPCIIITAKGMPDLATRALCHRLSSLPNVVPIGLVDFNPSGLTILTTYKHGSLKSGDGDKFLIPNLKWLGLRSGAIRVIQEQRLVGVGGREGGSEDERSHVLPCTSELTRRDRSLAAGLMTRLERMGEGGWCDELRVMTEEGWKSDLESLYSSAGGISAMTPSIARSIIRGDYI